MFSYHTNNFVIFNSKASSKSSFYVTQAIYGVTGDYIKWSCIDLVTGTLGRYIKYNQTLLPLSNVISSVNMKLFKKYFNKGSKTQKDLAVIFCSLLTG